MSHVVASLDSRSATGCTAIRKHKNNIIPLFPFGDIPSTGGGHPHPIDEDNRFEDEVLWKEMRWTLIKTLIIRM